MANNRLLIYCKECLGFQGIAKYYPVNWSGGSFDIDDFFEKHQACLEGYKGDLGMDADIFGLTTEMTWDGGVDWREDNHKLVPKESLEEWRKHE